MRSRNLLAMVSASIFQTRSRACSAGKMSVFQISNFLKFTPKVIIPDMQFAASAIKYAFARYEKKYLLTPDEYNRLRNEMGDRMKEDIFGWQEICNLYLDNDSDFVIRRSNEKRDFKDKLRIRSYGIVQEGGNAFIEFKKKFEHMVYKRRICVPYAHIEDLLYGRINHIKDVYPEIRTYADKMAAIASGAPKSKKIIGYLPAITSTQMEDEIKFFVKCYNCYPKIFLGYRRIGLFSPADKELRVTFDQDITYRRHDLSLQKGFYGTPYFDEPLYLMEIKTPFGIPMWLVEILSKLKLYREKFSKYGNIYRKEAYIKQELPYEKIKAMLNHNKGEKEIEVL
jgi:hypothetical protein